MRAPLLYLAVIFCLLTYSSASATHLKGGYITYTADKQNPLKYHFQLHAYNNADSPADDPAVTIRYQGLGTSTNVNRYSYTILGDGAALSLYKWEYTFSGTGTYTIYWDGINRSPNAMNISTGSDNFSMVIRTTILIGPDGPANNGVSFAAPATAIAYVGQPFKYNIRAYDVDGDQLVYNLTTPTYRDATGSVGAAIPGYSIPQGISFNRFGEISWQSPPSRGMYTFTILVEEYKNEVKVGQTFFELEIMVYETEKQPNAVLVNPGRYTYSTDGMILAKPNERLKLEFFLSDKTGSIVEAPEASSEFQLDYLSGYATQTTTVRDSLHGKVLEAVIIPTTSLVREQPYIVGTKAVISQTNSFYYKARSWTYTYIKVTGQSPMSSHIASTEPLNLYPNPVTDKIFIEEIEQKNAELQIWNVMGQQVVVTTLKAGKNIIKRPTALASGTYFYCIVSNGRRIKAGKLFFD